MGLCENCRSIIDDRYFFCGDCLQIIYSERIDPIKPSNVEDSSVEDVLGDLLISQMDKSMQKDIEELLQCIYYELWTATLLMSARILEKVLRAHISVDLGEKEPNSIGGCINILEKNDYPDVFLDLLDSLRDLRNDSMHGTIRADPQTALQTSKTVLHIVAWIFNIRLD